MYWSPVNGYNLKLRRSGVGGAFTEQSMRKRVDIISGSANVVEEWATVNCKDNRSRVLECGEPDIGKQPSREQLHRPTESTTLDHTNPPFNGRHLAYYAGHKVHGGRQRIFVTATTF